MSSMDLQENHSNSDARDVLMASNQTSCSRKAAPGVAPTVCANCGITSTPLWRRAPNGDAICNACGLYMKSRNTTRPQWLKRDSPKRTAPSSGDEYQKDTCAWEGQCDENNPSTPCTDCTTFNQYSGNRNTLICSNCGTDTTPLWRRDETGTTICNACGLYFKLHGVHRPVSMKRSVIKRRKRNFHSGNPAARNHMKPANACEENREGRPTCCHHDHCSAPKPEPIPHTQHNCCAKKATPEYECAPKHRQVEHSCGGTCKDSRSKQMTRTPESGLSAAQISPNIGQSPHSLPHIYKSSSLSPNLQSSDSSSPSSPRASDAYTPLVYDNSRLTLPPIQIPPLNSQGCSAPLPSSQNPFTAHELLSFPAPNQFTRKDLQVHRQELQREISHLSMLLSRTSSMLAGLDHAISLPASSTSFLSSPGHSNFEPELMYQHTAATATWSQPN